MACSLQEFILQDHTMEQIRTDFIAQFPEFTGLTNPVLDRFINQSFCNVPNGFVTCCCCYTAFLFGVAHNTSYFNNGSGAPRLQKNAKSKKADGLSISYNDVVSPGTPANMINFFSVTPYGMTLLEMLDSCGLTMSPGGFVV